MSGYPHGLDAPNRTGDWMNIREALENRSSRDGTGCHVVYVMDIVPIIERALRATAQEMAEMLTRVEAGDWLIDQCVTAGVAAMVEKES